MKCPKCQYIAFDQGGRCRNCGYEFSLSPDAPDLDLPIRTGEETDGPLSDFDLGGAGADAASALPDPVQAPPRQGSAQRVSRASELPLFRDRAHPDDVPLVNMPASPRAPISVRKSAVARHAQQPRPAHGEPALDLEPDAEAPRARTSPRHHRSVPADALAPARSGEPGSSGARVLAAAIDLLLLGAIDAAVLFLTLRMCGLTFDEVSRIPLVPLAAFLALLNGGYMAAFTAAGGQSIGKMLTHLRVVSVEEGSSTDRVRLGQSVLRAVGYLVSALPAGLGFLPALLAADRRTLHDRLAHTRVVRA